MTVNIYFLLKLEIFYWMQSLNGVLYSLIHTFKVNGNELVSLNILANNDLVSSCPVALSKTTMRLDFYHNKNLTFIVIQNFVVYKLYNTDNISVET